MAGRLLKCYGYCNEKYEKKDLVKIGGKNYCLKCAKRVQKDREERESLYNYIKNAYDVPMVTGYMLRQIKEYRESISYKDMEDTLRYCFEVLGKYPIVRYGVALIGHYHLDMLNYKKECKKNETRYNPMDKEPVKVKVIRKKRKRETNRIIDINKLDI